MNQSSFHRFWVGAALVVFLAVGFAPTLAAEPFPVEYYYKVKWGHFDEFLRLYKKNHYPILARLKEMGVIVDMSAETPFYHAGEGSRWDFRYTIVWKDAATAHEQDEERERKIVQELYPDQKTFKREEQRRFEILIEHMDIPVVRHDLSKWPKTP